MHGWGGTRLIARGCFVWTMDIKTNAFGRMKSFLAVGIVLIWEVVSL